MDSESTIKQLENLIDQADTYEGLIQIGKIIMKLCIEEITSGTNFDAKSKYKITFFRLFEKWAKVVKDAKILKETSEINKRLSKLETFKTDVEQDAKKR